MPAIRLFISYSHDSGAHRDYVLALANRLRADGLDCRIDQYVNGFPAEGWQRWMETQVETADFVLVVCTPLYLKRYRGLDHEGGRGVTFEGVVISQSLYDAYYLNTKFVPVLPEHGVLDSVPLPLKGFGAFRVMTEYEALYRYLTGQAKVVAPELGERLVKPLHIDGSIERERSSITHFLKRKRLESRAYNGMSTTVKTLWVGCVFTLLMIVAAGLFVLLAAPNITVSDADCALVNTGEITDRTTQDCRSK